MIRGNIINKPSEKRTDSILSTSDLLSEGKVLDAALRTREEIKNTPIIKMAQNRHIVTYFNQKLDTNNDSHINTNDMNQIDPEYKRYNRIDNFVVLFPDVLNLDTVKTDTSFLSAEKGSIVILPNTIAPFPNDIFLLEKVSGNTLYRITEVESSIVEDYPSYTLNFEVLEEDVDLDNNLMTNLVIGHYVFSYNHIGTGFRSVFKKSEYENITMLRDLYHYMGNIYRENFYDNKLNSFFLYYEKENGDKTIKEFIDADGSPFISPYYGDYDGKTFYDPELINFIVNNEIFKYLDGEKLVIPTVYHDIRSKNSFYNKTIFYSMETKNKKIPYKYQMPIELYYGTPGFSPVIRKKIILKHVSSISNGIYSFFPPQLMDSIESFQENTNHRDSFYDHIYLLLNEITAHYLNNVNTTIDDKLKFLYEKRNELNENRYKEYMFYMYPILAYIISERLKSLSDEEYDTKII